MHIMILCPPQGFTYNITLDDLCDVMTNTSLGDELDRYAAINSAYLKSEGLDYLDVSYEEYITSLKNTSWNSTTAEGGNDCSIGNIASHSYNVSHTSICQANAYIFTSPINRVTYR